MDVSSNRIVALSLLSKNNNFSSKMGLGFSIS